jgi:hypothetical protein
MIISGANFTAGPALAKDPAATCVDQGLCAGVYRANSLKAPNPVLTLSYSGRVGTFYSAARDSYCETYEPARPSAHGPIGRIESRFIGGRWIHMAYRFSGAAVCSSDDDVLLFEQSSLPLMFDPDAERAFAKHWLTSGAGSEVVNLPNNVVVYGSRDRSSLGIIRLKLSM